MWIFAARRGFFPLVESFLNVGMYYINLFVDRSNTDKIKG